MNSIGQNIKKLRKELGLTQQEFSEQTGIKRSLIGSYEENRATPKLSVIQDIANFFSISIDELISKSAESIKTPAGTVNKKSDSFKILSIVVDKEDNELIASVPIQATAGYTKGYYDPEYVGELPHFTLPLNELSSNKTYRVFQIKGDSMEPVKSGSYIICEYVLNPQDIINGKTYIVITKDDGIVYKRLYNKVKKTGEIDFKSDNPEYHTYSVHTSNILEIWKALGYISFQLPETGEVNTNKLYEIILNLQDEIKSLKKQLPQ